MRLRSFLLDRKFIVFSDQNIFSIMKGVAKSPPLKASTARVQFHR